MKKILFLVPFLISCNPPTIPDISVYVNQVVSIADGGKPDGIVSGSCAPVDRVSISSSPSQLAVGQSERIDVTPKDVNGKPRDPDCDIATGVNWTSNEDICTVQNRNEFVTNIKGIKAGTCTITAIVAGKTDSDSFPVL